MKILILSSVALSLQHLPINNGKWPTIISFLINKSPFIIWSFTIQTKMILDINYPYLHHQHLLRIYILVLQNLKQNNVYQIFNKQSHRLKLNILNLNTEQSNIFNACFLFLLLLKCKVTAIEIRVVAVEIEPQQWLEQW